MNHNLVEEIARIFRKEIKKLVESRGVQHNYNSTYAQTEKLLYSYPMLKAKVEQDKEEIESQEIHIPAKRSSTDVVRFKTGGAGFLAIEIEDRIEETKRRMERTERQIRRIERALKCIEDDEYYSIVEKKYFEGYTDRQIAEALYCDESTVGRHKKRLVSRVEILLFGADALQ